MNSTQNPPSNDSDFAGRVGFAIGTGRCGTKLVQKLFSLHSDVAASHERSPLNDAYHRYCQWYALPVDHAGFLHTKAAGIREDLAKARFSLEANPYLSLSLRELNDRFQARFVLLTRQPDEVVNSYVAKGWYAASYVQDDPAKALGYQEQALPHHYFSRIAPRGELFERWNAMSQVGKLAWFWAALNEATLEQLDGIPAAHWRWIKLEDLKNYDTYLQITSLFDIPPRIQPDEYTRLLTERVGHIPRAFTLANWNRREIEEFESQVRGMAEKLGYEYRVETLKSNAQSLPEAPVSPQKSARGSVIGRMAGKLLRRLKSISRTSHERHRHLR